MTAPEPPFTLVLLPGLGCDDELLAPQAAALTAAGHTVHTSRVHFEAPTLEAMAERLLQQERGPLVLVGASMGGMVALRAARQAATRVRGVALLGSTARADPPEVVALRQHACGLFAAGRIDEVLRANVPLALHPNSARQAATVARYLAMVKRAGAAALIAQNQAVLARHDFRAQLPHLALPLMVLVGEADRLTPPEHAHEIARAVPGARLETVPGAGHLPGWEQPARVNRLLRAWLETPPLAPTARA